MSIPRSREFAGRNQSGSQRAIITGSHCVTQGHELLGSGYRQGARP